MFNHSVVASILSYTVVCWAGSISKADLSRLEKLIRRAGSEGRQWQREEHKPNCWPFWTMPVILCTLSSATREACSARGCSSQRAVPTDWKTPGPSNCSTPNWGGGSQLADQPDNLCNKNMTVQYRTVSYLFCLRAITATPLDSPYCYIANTLLMHIYCSLPLSSLHSVFCYSVDIVVFFMVLHCCWSLNFPEGTSRGINKDLSVRLSVRMGNIPNLILILWSSSNVLIVWWQRHPQ